MNKQIDMLGRICGRLRVVGVTQTSHPLDNGIYWDCICECDPSKIVSVRGAALRRGATVSCGCCHRQMMSERDRTHGMSDTPIYGVWRSMRQRCNNPKDKKYSVYGAAGIRVCKEWDESFETFFADMGDTYQKGLVLDRRDGKRGYSKENCWWATYAESNRNLRRNVRVITPDGEDVVLADAADQYGICDETLRTRLRRGVTGDELFASTAPMLLDTPLGKMSVAQASKTFGIAKDTIRNRVYSGWPKERWLDPPARRRSR